MAYTEFTGNEAHEVICIRVRKNEKGDTVASLHRSGPVKEAGEYLFLPEGEFSVPEAIIRAEPLGIKHNAPIVIKVEEGAEWEGRWGELQ
ncbi:hypothetical protein [Devosia soli]|nr:hypothetical protein [Devosia soli]